MQKEAEKNEKKRMQWGAPVNPTNPTGKSEESLQKNHLEIEQHL